MGSWAEMAFVWEDVIVLAGLLFVVVVRGLQWRELCTLDAKTAAQSGPIY